MGKKAEVIVLLSKESDFRRGIAVGDERDIMKVIEIF